MHNKINVIITCLKDSDNAVSAFSCHLGKSLIFYVMKGLKTPLSTFTLLAKKSELDEYKEAVQDIHWNFYSEIIPIDDSVNNQADAIREYVSFDNHNEPVLITSANKVIDADFKQIINQCENEHLDGSILCIQEQINENLTLKNIGCFYFSTLEKYFSNVDLCNEQLIDIDTLTSRNIGINKIYKYQIKDLNTLDDIQEYKTFLTDIQQKGINIKFLSA